jgi:hypothetical protein
MAILYQIDFKKKKLINKSNTGSVANKQWVCYSCQSKYVTGDGIKGVAFSKDVTVCQLCIGEAHKMICKGGNDDSKPKE